jgi:hypothetical protein
MNDLFDNRPRRNLDGGRVISIRGAASTTSRMSTWRSRATVSWSSPA